MHPICGRVDRMEQPAEYPGDDGDKASYGSHPPSMAAIRRIGTGQEVPIEDGTGAPRRWDRSTASVMP